MKQHLQIGNYLKKLDNLLTEGIRRIHESVNITRLQWQLLNTVYVLEQANRSNLYAALEEFADKETVDKAIQELKSRNLLQETNLLILTDQGKVLHNTCLKRQEAFKRRVMQQISDEEYLQVLRVLEKMIINLEE